MGVASLSFCGNVFASNGNSAAAFLEIPVGAEPAALGGAYSAAEPNGYSPVWNPGALGFLNDVSVAAQHTAYLESLNYEYGGVAIPLGPLGGLGVSAQYLGTGSLVGTNESDQLTGDFSSHYAAYALAYGRRLNATFSLGAAAKWLDAAISDVHASAYAFDGGLYARINRRVRLAAVIANAGKQLRFLNEGDGLPLALRVGAAWDMRPVLTLSGEVVDNRDTKGSAHVGAEWRPIRALALRAGYRSDVQSGALGTGAGWSVGIGLKILAQEFSYAWVPFGDLGNSQYFSLVLHFGGGNARPVLQSSGEPEDHP